MNPRHSVSRRTLLVAGMSVTVASAMAKASAAAPQSQGHKLVVVILRGAMDGLAALPKVDDPDIRQHRAALIDPNARPIADGFALHSAFANLATLYQSREAAFIPATAGPYRERSHFEAQDLLECGGVSSVSRDGWLNRALQKAPGAYTAVSIGPVQPLILRGASAAASSWSPAVLPEASDDTLHRLLDLYENDPVLKPALVSAVGADMVASTMAASDGAGMQGQNMQGMGGGRGGPGQYVPLMSAAGRFLSQAEGPEIAVVSLEGWDTHTQQNGALQQRFAALDNAIAALKQQLGPAWAKTAVVCVTEFGRTVRVNGGGGTDHGTAGLVILAGGAVKGGRIMGDWPTLRPAALFENRDLAPTTDARSAFKGLLRDHLGWSGSDLDAAVFPQSGPAGAMAGLV
jgi:uncharacterized protein (DUF1501 family)